ncbi:MAG: hypothetical protein FJ390_02830 [Verrucomicrobia bacterium]|nr:hypothetical protein [Verrucomicrobiota bacterium]
MNGIFLFFLVTWFAYAPLFAVEQKNTSPIIRVSDYYSMLTRVPDATGLYSDEMAADPEGCGIIRMETDTGYAYKMVAGMENQPMKGMACSVAAAS